MIEVLLAELWITWHVCILSCVWLVLLRNLRRRCTVTQINCWCLLDTTSLFLHNWNLVHRIVDIQGLYSSIMAWHFLLETYLRLMTTWNLTCHRALSRILHYIFRAQISASKFILDVR